MPLRMRRSMRKWSMRRWVLIAALTRPTPDNTITTGSPRSLPVVKRWPAMVQVFLPWVSLIRMSASAPKAETMPMRGVHSERQAGLAKASGLAQASSRPRQKNRDFFTVVSPVFGEVCHVTRSGCRGGLKSRISRTSSDRALLCLELFDLLGPGTIKARAIK